MDNRVDMKSVPIAQYGVRSTDVTTILLHRSPHGCSYGPERDLVAAHCLEFVQRILTGLPPARPLEPDGSEE
jgi:hypothetical protein